MRTLQRAHLARSSRGSRKQETTARSFLTMLMEARDAETGAAMTRQAAPRGDARDAAAGARHRRRDARLDVVPACRCIRRSSASSTTKSRAGRRRSRSGRRRPPAAPVRATWSCRSRCGCIRRSGSSRATRSRRRSDRRLSHSCGIDDPAQPLLTHRHPDFWENPEAFDPERFLPARSHDRPRHAYFPFGGGPRLCMGVDMAMMEMLLIMAMVVQRLPRASGAGPSRGARVHPRHGPAPSRAGDAAPAPP